MVGKRRATFVAITTATLLAAAAAPVFGGFSSANPDPLRQKSLIRIQDVAAAEKTGAHGNIVAVGWREGAKPGQLYLTFSTNGGKTYLKGNGNMRRAPIAGAGNLGMSVDSCGNDVWVGSSARAPGDRAGDSDVLMTRRVISGGAGQVFVTAPSVNRKVRDVSVACVGKRLLAVAWLEQSGGKFRARLMLRDLKTLAPAATKRVFGLGNAKFKGGITVAANGNSVHVAWTHGTKRNMRYKRFDVGAGADPSISKNPTTTVGFDGVIKPEIAVRGTKVSLAYVKNGKVFHKLSTNLGDSFGPAQKLIDTGTKAAPSSLYSVDISGDRIVVETGRYKGGKTTTERVQSTNLGSTWKSTVFGNKGPRMGGLIKIDGSKSKLGEGWHNNGTNQDKLRASYEN
jgi:hypothetical protein